MLLRRVNCVAVQFCFVEDTPLTLAEYVCPSAFVRRFQIEDGVLLFNADSDCLFVLNSTASYLWDLIGIQQTKENLASELSRAWEIPVSRARADVDLSWRNGDFAACWQGAKGEQP